MELAFSCKFCGHCCQGKGGIVLGPSDLQKLCSRLSLTSEEFIHLYCVTTNGKNVIKTNDSGFCVFFDSQQGCSVHEDKPRVCKAWPYFRGNLIDAESLTLAKDYCPGIHQEITLQEFQQQGLAYILEHNLQEEGSTVYAKALYIADLLAPSKK